MTSPFLAHITAQKAADDRELARSNALYRQAQHEFVDGVAVPIPTFRTDAMCGPAMPEATASSPALQPFLPTSIAVLARLGRCDVDIDTLTIRGGSATVITGLSSAWQSPSGKSSP